MQPEQQQRIMGYFIEEAKDHLNTIEQGLLNLQNTIQDTEMVNEVFRAAHSVKGGAAMLGLSSVQQTAHWLEDCFKVLKERPVTIDQKLESLFLHVFDILQELIEQLQSPFGLTDEIANRIMSGVEPIFKELNNHLESLVSSKGGAAVVGQQSQAPQQDRKALQQIFQQEILVHLREMLQLFKQADEPSRRQKLQEICAQMSGIGKQFDLPTWTELLDVSSAAIASPENSFRTLAGIVIKEIKQAQELVLAGREAEVLPSVQLKALVPKVTVVESSPLEIADALMNSGWETPVVSASLTTYTDDVSTEIYEPVAQQVETAAISSQPRRMQPSTNKSTPAVKPGADPNGPEVGMAELNSLADLFEGESPELDESWQEEEIVNHADTKQVQHSSQSLPVDAQSDFSDLLGDMDGYDTPAPADASQTDDLMNLFGDEFLEEAAVATTDGGSKKDTVQPVANSTLETSDDDFSDLLFGDDSSSMAAGGEASDNLTNLFGDELSFDEDSEPLDLTASLDLSFDSASVSMPEQQEDLFFGLSDLETADSATPTADEMFLDLPDLETADSATSTADEMFLDLPDLETADSATPTADEMFLDLPDLETADSATPTADEMFLDLPDLEPATLPSSEALDLLADEEESLTDWLTDVDENDSQSLGLDLEQPEAVQVQAAVDQEDEWLFAEDEVEAPQVGGLADQEEAIALSFDTEMDSSSLFEEEALLPEETTEFSDLFTTSETTPDHQESFAELAIDDAELGLEELASDDSAGDVDFDNMLFRETPFVEVDAPELALDLELDTSVEVSADESFSNFFDEEPVAEADSFDFDSLGESENVPAIETLDNFFDTEPEALNAEPALDLELDTNAEATADESFSNFFEEESVAEADSFDFNALSESENVPAIETLDNFFDTEPEALSAEPAAFELPVAENLEMLFGDEVPEAIESQDTASDWNLDEGLQLPEATEQLEALFDETVDTPDSVDFDLDLFTSDALETEAVTEPAPMSLETAENNLEATKFLAEDENLWTLDGLEEDSALEAPISLDRDSSDPLAGLGIDEFLEFSDAGTDEGTSLDDLLATADERLAFEDDLSLAPSEEATEFVGADEFDALEALLNEAPQAIGSELNGADEFDQLEALLATEPASAISEAEVTDDWGDLDAMLLGDEEAPQTASSPASTEATTKETEVDDFGDMVKMLDDAENMGMISTGKQSPGNRPRVKVFEQTMRVSVKHLDNLSNLVGELVVNRNSLEEDQERMRQSLDNLLNYVQQLSDVGSRMQDLYERSLLESSLLASRQNYRSPSKPDTSSQSSFSSGMDYDPLEMDRFTPIHLLSQEMIELIVRVRESASDIEFLVDETDQVARMLRQVTTQLQEGLTRSRMVPFAQTVDRLQRGVRDNARKYGKQVDLHVEGRETLIDKVILEHLLDPLTHMLNNGIAHGIEPPEVRRAYGKTPTGRITLRAFHQGNQTVISVSDDGAGIDTERVKAKALKMGLIKPSEAQTISAIDIYDLLFHPGFSMKDKADELAGRGVGMDVVRTSLTEIRGTISTESTLGKGTTFTIRLPLTLSISKALYCVSDKASIAFPMDGVEDMLDVPKDRIQLNREGKPCIPWRDTLLSFQPLSELLTYNRQISRGSVYGGTREDNMISIVVLRSVGNYIAIEVDKVEGEQEIVIKQLQGPVPKPIGIAGATVLGDGRIMPIADILELIDLSRGIIRKETGTGLWSGVQTPAEIPAVKQEPMVLIVDDSITVRELLSMTFNKAGYRVEQARDGQEAWDKLRSGLPCDIVFCDIEMPRMDGLELLSRLQKDEALNHLPVAMLTSRGADRHRQMAAQLGASGYFTKPYLEEALLDAAQRMMKGEVLLTSSANA